MKKRKYINRLLRLFRIISRFFSSIIAYSYAFLLDIEMGKGNIFYGLPHFCAVGDEAIIKIGNKNTFRSSMTSNLAGLNHRTMIACKSTAINRKPELIIGNNCGFSGTTIICFSKIIIGNNVRVGGNSIIRDGDNHFTDPRATQPQPIIIDDNVWIGANCLIKKGVHIGANSLIGMNSVVTKDVPANCVAVGVPAKVIRTI